MWLTKNLAYLEGLELADWLLFGLYIIFILVLGYYVKTINAGKKYHYRYYFLGLLIKIVGAVLFVLIYIYYYRGGDTVAYYECSRAYVNLLYERPFDFFEIYFNGPSQEDYAVFSNSTGFPWGYMYNDTKTLTTVKLITPLLVFGMSSFLLSTVLLSWISFFILWDFFDLLCERYRGKERILFIGVFALPSVIFWGSGLLKDSLTLMFSLLYITSFYRIIINKSYKLKGFLLLFLCVFIIAAIKPYILIALFPGSLIWIFFTKINAIRNQMLRYSILVLIPLVILIISGGIQTVAGGDEVEALLQEASVKQRDLQQDYYQGSSFNIGLYEPTLQGALSVAPAAINAALYRPYVWEAQSVVMLMSGFENFILLILTIYAFAMNGFIGVVKKIIEDPFMIFFFMYVLLFALLVGLSTSNFGALVRFKIAYLPEFFLLIVLLIQKEKKNPYQKI
jgi:hypothetical protein